MNVGTSRFQQSFSGETFGIPQQANSCQQDLHIPGTSKHDSSREHCEAIDLLTLKDSGVKLERSSYSSTIKDKIDHFPVQSTKLNQYVLTLANVKFIIADFSNQI